MDLRRFLFLYEVRILPKSFEMWRDGLIKEYDIECGVIYKEMLEKKPYLFQRYMAIKHLPKTLFRLTRQMCACNDYCLKYSTYYTKFDENCTLYDLRDLLTDDNFYDSSFVVRKVIYNRLEPRDYFVDEDGLKMDFYNGLIDLCKGTKDAFNNLKCKAYELRDYCNNNKTCYENMLDSKAKSLYYDSSFSREICVNINFRSDLFKLRAKAGIPMLYRLDRTKRELVKDEEPYTVISYKMNYGGIKLFLGSLLSFLIIITLKKKYYKLATFICLVLLSVIKICIEN